MALKIYNTLTRNKEEFVPLTPGDIRMYVCGVTVYDYCHVGHARSFIAFDIVYRYLEHLRYNVKFVKNYTDIDDNIINRSNETGEDWRELTAKFMKAYDEDLAALGCRKPTIEPKATDHIQDMQDLIAALIEGGKAYVADGDVYFSVRSDRDYGKLSNRNVDDLASGARIEPGDAKRDPLDFALWKGAKPGEPSWDSPWGKGRPGWHIECSAMSAHYLGQPFDIHGGGEDLVFPHHENEIAQSEGATGKGLANVWMHNGMLRVNKEKMSKSLGNFFTIREVLARYEAEALRISYLSAHYRRPCEFSDAALEEATDRLERLYRPLAEVEARKATAASMTLRVGEAKGDEVVEARQLQEGLEARFREAMDDDFNTPRALAVLFEVARVLNRMTGRKPWTTGDSELAEDLARRLEALGNVLGLLTGNAQAVLDRVRDRRARGEGVDPAWVDERIAARTQARKDKDFQQADAIRDELAAKGVLLEDTPQTTTWRFRRTSG